MGKHARSKAALAAAAATAVLSKEAHATTANEGDFGDFGDDFASETLLPIGTDVVNGSVGGGIGDNADFLSFQGLLPGGSFTLNATHDAAPNFLFLTEFNDGGGFLQSEDDNGSGAAALSGTIPLSGELHFSITAEGGPSYQLTLSAPLPEPTGAALLGGGLLAAAVLRRLRARSGS